MKKDEKLSDKEECYGPVININMKNEEDFDYILTCTTHISY